MNVGTLEEVFVILRIMRYGHVLLTLVCNSRIPMNKESEMEGMDENEVKMEKSSEGTYTKKRESRWSGRMYYKEVVRSKRRQMTHISGNDTG